MQLDAYLRRIGIARPQRADLDALCAVHRAHLLAIPYENLDVQLGLRTTTSVAECFEKIVTRGRGGWCYEMNGLLGWALQELGFRVTRCAAAVMRETRGDSVMGNHLVLKVDLEEGHFLADAGFGDGPIDPIRVVPGAFTSHGVRFALTQPHSGWWRLANLDAAVPDSFDFNLVEADERALDAQCSALQTSADSTFVQNLVAIRYAKRGITTLRGRTLKYFAAGATTVRLLHSPEELVDVLRSDIGLHVPEAASLWPKIVARHEVLFAGERPAEPGEAAG
jgi:N-hydroxyarylamine O-acetyltransferase